MQKTRLGRTGLYVSRVAVGALPIQRADMEKARDILLKAYENGINFFDTARGYSDSEEKIGYALSDVRKNIFIASKSGATGRKGFFADLHTSLKNLRTDYIDLYQLHNPSVLPDPEDPESSCSAALEAKKMGLIRHVGITNHKVENARAAIDSGIYETVQFPFSMLSSDDDKALVGECAKKDIGFIAMKALSGGLITDAAVAFAFLWQYENVVPIWGIQRMSELDEFLSLEKELPLMDEQMMRKIEGYRKELSGSFCRGCGYCMPCPVGIPINMAARISLLLKRAPTENFLNPDWYSKMKLIEDCRKCGSCKNKCPYGLDVPALLEAELEKYMKEFN